MAKITLRAYIHEIESMVEKGHLEEAIAHCQHIIQSFPKLIAAYRLLGKAYLEGQRYGDAADIFQRVLSAIPDDFMAHVGMSIIREDEGNINSAIWHMERAFEAQPYNAAIQEELRRLYGRRDGLEPTKIRLTRGALARMYARGSLYQQAIAELRAALADDPHRPDLQVLLARMYFLSGQQVEAVDTCSSLIKKLPYCLEANRILAKILPETGRKEDSQAYNQRVNALDPYLLHASPSSTTADEVPDNLVVTDKLDFVRSRPVGEHASQPEWAASLGVQVGNLSQKDQSLPEWLSGEDQEGKTGVVPPFEEEPAEESNLIPDWMKQAGWQEGSGEAEELPTFEAPEPEAVDQTVDEAAPGDIPDWLREMAPDGSNDDSDNGVLEGEIPDWLQEMAPEEVPPLETFTGEEVSFTAEELSTAKETVVPDWLKELAPDIAEDATIADASVKESLEQDSWVSGEESLELQEEATPLMDAGVSSEEIPDWMREQPAETEAVQAEADIPEWLQELAPEETEPAAESTEEIELFPEVDAAPVESDTPDWLQEISAEVTEETPTAALESLTDVSTEEEIAVGETAPLESELPDWLRELAPAEAVEFEWDIDELEPASDEPVSIIEPEEAVQEDLPEWLKELAHEEAGTPAVTLAPSEPDLSDPDAALAWLEGLAANQGAPEEELITSPEERPTTISIPDEIVETRTEADVPAGVPTEELPDWLKESLSETPEPVSKATDVPDLTDPDAALAWLETLAARQGGSEDELITEPEERPSVPSAAVEEIPLVEDISTNVDEAEIQPEAFDAAGLPSFTEELVEFEAEAETFEESEITQLAEEVDEPEAEAEMFEVSEAPALVEDVVEFEGEEEISEVSEPPAVSEEIVEFETIEELFEAPEIAAQAEEIVEPVVEAEVPEPIEVPLEPEEVVLSSEDSTADELPDWLKELVQEEEQTIDLSIDEEQLETVELIEEEVLPEPTEVEQEGPESLEDTDAALAWLEGLAARQGVSEEELVSKPDERPGETPDWLKELAEADDFQPEALDEDMDLVESQVPSAPEIPVEEKIEVEEVELPVSEDLPSWILDAASAPIHEESWSPSVDEFSSEAEIVEEPLEKLDINTASLIELETLPGMGFIRAQNILAFRESNGEFNELDELRNVHGFSPELIRELKPLLKAVVTKAKPVPVSAPAPVPADSSDQSLLANARTLLSQGNLTEALDVYERLIRKRFSLDDVIWDLKSAVAKSPEDSSLWQTLGDAYMRSDRLKDAMEAYNEAERFIR